MTLLTYRNADGKELAIGEGRLKLLSVEGLESPPVSLAVSTGPAVGGAIALSKRGSARKIKVHAMIDLHGLNEAETNEARQAVFEALDDEQVDGELEVSRSGRTRRIEARPLKEPCLSMKAWNEEWQTMSAEFICARPFFMDVATQTMGIQYYEEMAEFGEAGIEFLEEGREFSTILCLGMSLATVSNPGNVDTPIQIRFSGPIVNPFISNHTRGESIRIPRVIREGEYVEIDTTPGRREIRHYADGIVANGMHYLDLASKFWKLLPGDNEIEIGNDSPGDGSGTSFEYHPHYREA